MYKGLIIARWKQSKTTLKTSLRRAVSVHLMYVLTLTLTSTGSDGGRIPAGRVGKENLEELFLRTLMSCICIVSGETL